MGIYDSGDGQQTCEGHTHFCHYDLLPTRKVGSVRISPNEIYHIFSDSLVGLIDVRAFGIFYFSYGCSNDAMILKSVKGFFFLSNITNGTKRLNRSAHRWKCYWEIIVYDAT